MFGNERPVLSALFLKGAGVGVEVSVSASVRTDALFATCAFTTGRVRETEVSVPGSTVTFLQKLTMQRLPL